MNLRSKTSKLLSLRNAADAELNARFAEIFEAHRAIAFMDRRDQMFREHWTPELAASRYHFSGFEISGSEVVLLGSEIACGFDYRISIAFPKELIDNRAAIDSYFKEHYRKGSAEAPPEAGSEAPDADSVRAKCG